MADKLDEKNKEAENLNPDRTGMRTGNPQLDTPAKPASSEVSGDKPHAPPGSGGRPGEGRDRHG
jgi:hypothetical protein